MDFLSEKSFLHMLSSTLGLDENTTYGYQGTKVSVQEAQEGYLAADRASSIWIREAVRRIETDSVDKVPPQLVKFFGWMKRWLASDYCREIMTGIGPDDETRIRQDIESSVDSAELQLLARVGKALPNRVSGAVEPLDVMLQDNLLSKDYESGTFTGDYEAAVAYLKLLKPGGSLVLLEIAPRGAAVGLVAGTLTGWWAHEDEFRVDTPLLYRDQ